jgi:hypothetical protein
MARPYRISPRPRGGGRPAPAGQSMTELALVLPILLLLVLALADGGRAFALGIRAQNLAKQAAVFIAQHYADPTVIGPVSCMQTAAQQLVTLEGGGSATVALTTTTPISPGYSGEVEVRATVSYTFTPMTPLLSAFGDASHPFHISATHAEQVQIPIPAANDPGSAIAMTVTRNLADASKYYDQIGWTMPMTWAPAIITDTSLSPAVSYVTTFRLFAAPTPDLSTACVASAPVPAVPGVTSYGYPSHSRSNTMYYYYWVVAYWPALPPDPGAAGTPAGPQ